MDFPIYEVVFKEGDTKGVYAMSVVSNPAMQDQWILLEEQRADIQFEAVDKERRLLLGAALIPNKKIFRNINGHKCYVTFTEETIEKIAHSFMKDEAQNNSSLQHKTVIEGTTVVETWMVEDTLKDKSAIYGKSYEPGTWVILMKADNQEIWDKAKQGEITGFSVEAVLGLQELQLKSEIMPESKTIAQAIEEGFKAFFKKNEAEVKLGEVTLKDGKTKLIFEGETPEVGKAVFIKPEKGDEEKIAAPAGEHELEGGDKLYVDEDGLVAAEPEKEPEVNEKEIAEAIEAKMKEVKANFDAKLAKQKKDFEIKLKALEDEKEELEEKLEAIPAQDKPFESELKMADEPKTSKQRLMNAVLAAQNSN